MKKFILTLAFFAVGGMAVTSPSNALEAMYGLTGLYVNKPEAYQGYTLVFPEHRTEAYLVDMEGRVAHTWTLPGSGFYGELLPNGNLLACLEVGDMVVSFGGGHGRLVELDKNSKIVWEVTRNSKEGLLHHGFDRMPNGHTLALSVEEHSWKDAQAKGRQDVPSGPVKSYDGRMVDGIWSDTI